MIYTTYLSSTPFALTSRIKINTAFQTILPFQEHKRRLVSSVIQDDVVSWVSLCRLKEQK